MALLTQRLSDLIDEQTTLFIFERPYLLDWLKIEQLTKKYPDLNESIKINKLYIKATMEELFYLFNQDISEKQLDIFT